MLKLQLMQPFLFNNKFLFSVKLTLRIFPQNKTVCHHKNIVKKYYLLFRRKKYKYNNYEINIYKKIDFLFQNQTSIIKSHINLTVQEIHKKIK